MNARELIANIERTIERTTDECGNDNPEIVIWVHADYGGEKSQKHTVKHHFIDGESFVWIEAK